MGIKVMRERASLRVEWTDDPALQSGNSHLPPRPVKPARAPLTEREQSAWLHLRGQLAVNRIPPTVRELGALLGVSIRRVGQLLDGLAQKGWIKRRPGASRAITLTDGETHAAQ